MARDIFTVDMFGEPPAPAAPLTPLAQVAHWRELYEDGTYHQPFWKWLPCNMHIFAAYVAAALKAHSEGRRAAAHQLVYELRNNTDLCERSAGGVLKLNQNSSSGMSRLAMQLYPQLRGYFRLRVNHKSQARRLDDGELYSSHTRH